MNFKDHEKDIQKLLLLGTRKTVKNKISKTHHKGVYLFSRDKNDSVHKIGVSYGQGGLFNRLKSYKICFPYKSEYYIQLMVITATSDDAKKLEKVMLTQKSLKTVEANTSAQGRRSREYRVTTKRIVLNNIIARVLDRNPNLWSHLLIFAEDSWKIITNKGHAIKSLQRPSIRSGKKGLFGGRKTKN